MNNNFFKLENKSFEDLKENFANDLFTNIPLCIYLYIVFLLFIQHF